eukprot:gene7650-15658_t
MASQGVLPDPPIRLGNFLQSIQSNEIRPPNPFIRGNSNRLKPAAVPVTFVEIILDDFNTQWRKTATDRLRFLDSLRMYTPLAEEKANCHIPDSSDRLNIHTTHDILILCGGRAGVRFTSEDLNMIAITIESLQKELNAIDSFFQTIPMKTKRIILSDDIIAITCQKSINFNFNTNISNNTDNNSNILNTVTPFTPSTVTVTDKQIIEFHEMCDKYTNILLKIQCLVKEKRNKLRENNNDQ